MTTKIMAIINLSPDSFSGDGVTTTSEIEAQIQKAIDDGADMLDLGGQSTRPGAEIISIDDEIQRVVPAIQIARHLTDLPISIDTFKPAVAQAALDAGATIINDIHGCQDPDMISLVRERHCPVVIMHSRGTPETMSQMTDYPRGVVTEVKEFLDQQAKRLIEAGIPLNLITIDPGIGFAKTAAQSFELTHELDELKALGLPVLYGASRKSFLGKALIQSGEPLPAVERLHATTVTTTYALQHNVDIIRVHDVRAAVDARRIVACIEQPELMEDN